MQIERSWLHTLAIIVAFTNLSLAGLPAFSDQGMPQSCIELLNPKKLTVLELELRLRSADGRLMLVADEIVNLLTTSNGQVNGLLTEAEIKDLPHHLKSALHAVRPGELTFETLPSGIRYELIRFAFNQRRQKDPTAGSKLGLRMRSRLTFRWTSDRLFLEKLYSAGSGKVVDISPLLNSPLVEVGGDDLSTIKIRFQSNVRSPQDLVSEIFTLLEGRHIGKSKALLRVIEL